MKNKILKYLAIIIGAIALDQISKGILLYLITGGIPWFGAAWDVVPVPYMMMRVCDFFNIVFTWNPGASFSMLRDLGEAAPLIIIIATGFIIGFIAYYLFARAKSVVDFLDFHVGAWHYPAFNIADMCIVIGVILFILNWYLARRRCLDSVKSNKEK